MGLENKIKEQEPELAEEREYGKPGIIGLAIGSALFFTAAYGVYRMVDYILQEYDFEKEFINFFMNMR